MWTRLPGNSSIPIGIASANTAIPSRRVQRAPVLRARVVFSKRCSRDAPSFNWIVSLSVCVYSSTLPFRFFLLHLVEEVFSPPLSSEPFDVDCLLSVFFHLYKTFERKQNDNAPYVRTLINVCRLFLMEKFDFFLFRSSRVIRFFFF